MSVITFVDEHEFNNFMKMVCLSERKRVSTASQLTITVTGKEPSVRNVQKILLEPQNTRLFFFFTSYYKVTGNQTS